jgi:hypothetical protein
LLVVKHFSQQDRKKGKKGKWSGEKEHRGKSEAEPKGEYLFPLFISQYKKLLNDFSPLSRANGTFMLFTRAASNFFLLARYFPRALVQQEAPAPSQMNVHQTAIETWSR